MPRHILSRLIRYRSGELYICLMTGIRGSCMCTCVLCVNYCKVGVFHKFWMWPKQGKGQQPPRSGPTQHTFHLPQEENFTTQMHITHAVNSIKQNILQKYWTKTKRNNFTGTVEFKGHVGEQESSSVVSRVIVIVVELWGSRWPGVSVTHSSRGIPRSWAAKRT